VSAADAAASGRAAAEREMTDTCRIERTGPVQTSQDGHDTTPILVLYEGPCRIKPAGTAAVIPSVTAPTETWQHKLSIPYGATGGIEVRAFDAVIITSSADASYAGLRLQVRNVDRGTHITARRLWCTEVSR
jgi:hypothetical protein